MEIISLSGMTFVSIPWSKVSSANVVKATIPVLPLKITTDWRLSKKVEQLNTVFKTDCPREQCTDNLEVCWSVLENGIKSSLQVTVKDKFLQLLYKLCLAALPEGSSSRAQIKARIQLWNWVGVGEYWGRSKLPELNLDLTTERLCKDGVISATHEIQCQNNFGELEIELFLEGEHISKHLRHLLLLNPTFPKIWRILNSQSGDFTLISKDGKRFPCHKVFLRESPVLDAMISSSFEEGVNNEAHLKEISAEGIAGLLDYLYLGILIWAKTDAGLAVELLQVAHQYLLPVLEEEVQTVLWKMDPKVFTGEQVLDLYRFSRNYTGDNADCLNIKVNEIFRSIDKAELAELVDDLDMDIITKAISNL